MALEEAPPPLNVIMAKTKATSSLRLSRSHIRSESGYILHSTISMDLFRLFAQDFTRCLMDCLDYLFLCLRHFLSFLPSIFFPLFSSSNLPPVRYLSLAT